jgi:hypothetical protein
MKRFGSTVAFALAALPIFATGVASAMMNVFLPPEETQGAVTYRTGGIGHEEATAMKHVEANYPLALEFVAKAEPDNWFLADVAVTIKDAHGHAALATYSDGPFLFAKLPDGRYTVAARYEGKSESQHVNVAATKPERFFFIW